MRRKMFFFCHLKSRPKETKKLDRMYGLPGDHVLVGLV